MPGDRDESLERIVGELLRSRRLTLATAESCTGGRIGSLLTRIADSSDFYRGGIICYHNDLKIELAGVQEATLIRYGAVSEPAAYEMARGVRTATASDLGLSVTGIAGPGGAVEEKPVGLVFLGLSSSSETRVEKHLLSGGREEIQMRSAHMALNWVRRFLQ